MISGNVSDEPICYGDEDALRRLCTLEAIADPACLESYEFQLADDSCIIRIVLSGGVFQNGFLTERVNEKLCAEAFEVFTHSRVPPMEGLRFSMLGKARFFEENKEMVLAASLLMRSVYRVLARDGR